MEANLSITLIRVLAAGLLAYRWCHNQRSDKRLEYRQWEDREVVRHVTS